MSALMEYLYITLLNDELSYRFEGNLFRRVLKRVLNESIVS